jgi:hypothetical protein
MAQPVGARDDDRRGRLARVAYLAAVVVILGLGLVVRVIPVRSALPYSSYVDEGHVLHPTAHMIAHNTWQGGRYLHPYQHPALLYDLTAGAAETARFLGASQVKTGAQATDRSRYYDIMEPEALILAGRLVVVALGIGVVALTMRLAHRLVGRTAALAAGLMTAMLPSLVSRSPIVITDTPAAFFVMLALVCLAEAQVSPRATRWLVAAGAASGLAFTAKYPSGAVFLAVVVFVWREAGMERAQKWRVVRNAAIAGAAAALITMPDLLLAPHNVIVDVASEVKVYAHKTTDTNYAQAFVDRHEVGWILLVLAVAGLVVLTRRSRPQARAFTIAWAGFAIPFVVYLLPQRYQPFRNLLPVLPYLAIAAAAALVGGARWAGARLHLAKPIQNGAVVVVAALVALAMFFMGVKPFIDSQANIVDSRTSTVEWLRTHANPGDRVLVARELAILPTELARIPGKVTVKSAKAPLSARQLRHYDFVVTGPLRPTAPEWMQLEQRAPTVRFGARRTDADPSSFRTNRARVFIYRNAGT